MKHPTIPEIEVAPVLPNENGARTTTPKSRKRSLNGTEAPVVTTPMQKKRKIKKEVSQSPDMATVSPATSAKSRSSSTSSAMTNEQHQQQLSKSQQHTPKQQQPAKLATPMTMKSEVSTSESPNDVSSSVTSSGGRKGKLTEDQKRKNFLERNRVAASKCRQRKKEMVEKMRTDLQHQTQQNQQLTMENNQLREQPRTMLLY
ncbi:unnamed protein product [Ambrosiozyma monospora]|uniref:Unnamed protein product n=1 Tax=Ambrosiozyma monospora TaxID=43982 RepID=A0A9W6SZX1_AMBMO|nr:unnamed protein product [Ambrosiozyma monospora]